MNLRSFFCSHDSKSVIDVYLRQDFVSAPLDEDEISIGILKERCEHCGRITLSKPLNIIRNKETGNMLFRLL